MTNQQHLSELSATVKAKFQRMLLTMELGSDRQFKEAKAQWEESEKALRNFREHFAFSGASMSQQWSQPGF
jgi:hypothetical protein